ncbi:hypothetical protein WDW89_23605, partial [Deltaproteobacteria bacterium TL4]
VPEGIDSIQLSLEIAGRTMGKQFKAAPRLQYQYLWDGKDGSGNFVEGNTAARIGIGFVNSTTGQTQWEVFTQHISNPTSKDLGLGGWSFKIHHFYDKQAQTLYLGNGSQRKVTKTIPLFGEYVSTFNIISLDGSQLYIFNARGLHLKTLNTTKGTMLYQFTYDSSGYLTQIEERQSKLFSSTLKTTQIQRNGSRLTALVASNGKITNLELDAQGYLSNITSPSGKVLQFHSADNGLMESFTDSKNQSTQYTFDHKGRLKTLKDALGGIWDNKYSVEENKSRQMTMTSPLGRITTSESVSPYSGNYYQINKTSTGSVNTTQLSSDGSISQTESNGMKAVSKITSDPRWDGATPILQNKIVTTPSGLKSETFVKREIRYRVPGDKMSMVSQTDTLTINGETFTQTYHAENRTQTTISAEGRKTVITYNELGKVISQEVPGMKKLLFTYDDQQRISSVTQ